MEQALERCMTGADVGFDDAAKTWYEAIEHEKGQCTQSHHFWLPPFAVTRHNVKNIMCYYLNRYYGSDPTAHERTAPVHALRHLFASPTAANSDEWKQEYAEYPAALYAGLSDTLLAWNTDFLSNDHDILHRKGQLSCVSGKSYMVSYPDEDALESWGLEGHFSTGRGEPFIYSQMGTSLCM